jgi:hypothetical protein
MADYEAYFRGRLRQCLYWDEDDAKSTTSSRDDDNASTGEAVYYEVDNVRVLIMSMQTVWKGEQTSSKYGWKSYLV